MKLRKLMATKPHRYGTRHLTAGEEYEAPPRHAIALVAGKKARFADNKPARAPAAKTEPAVEEQAEAKAEAVVEEQAEAAVAEPMNIDRLRMEATQLGIDFDGRWGVARLQHEIAQAKR